MTVAPDDPQGLMQRADAALQLRDLSSASAYYERAAMAGADADACSAARWMIAMLRGDLGAAWRESDSIRARGGDDPHRFWQGEDLTDKRVMLRCLHGFGDTVQMLRYAPALAQVGRSLTIEVAPPMVELTTMFEGVQEVISWGDHAPAQQPAWDVQIEVNELPYIFRTQANDLPVQTNYLKLPETLLSSVRVDARSRGRLRVGVVWESGEWNTSRSIPFEQFAPVLSVPGVEFWNLQGGHARTAWHTLEGQQFHPAEECTDNIPHLAALIAQLDLVVTTDTLAAHLAGAVGTPAWVMLSYAADWRWQHGRDDSPWYPSLRLYRQHWPGDWAGVIEEVMLRLHHAARQNATEPLVA